MGVYIKGMNMPKTCGECKMHFLSMGSYVCCRITDRIPKSVGKFIDSKIDLDARKKSIMSVKKPKWCPLVEAKTPHGDLINMDYQEPKTGHWVHGEYCSNCGCDVPAYIIDWKWQNDIDAKYCPNCGAKMIEPQESEE